MFDYTGLKSAQHQLFSTDAQLSLQIQSVTINFHKDFEQKIATRETVKRTQILQIKLKRLYEISTIFTTTCILQKGKAVT